MVESRVVLEMVGGTMLAEPGGRLPNAATTMPLKSVTVPQVGHTGYWDDGHGDTAYRTYFQFTPEANGKVYAASWPSHWVDAEGRPLDLLPEGATNAKLWVGTLRPPTEWDGPDHGTGTWHYDWLYAGTDECVVEVTAGVTYTVLLTRGLGRPPEGVEVHLVLALSGVQIYTPWQEQVVVPTLLRDGEPLNRPPGRGELDAPGDGVDDDPEQDDYRARSRAHFVGRT